VSVLDEPNIDRVETGAVTGDRTARQTFRPDIQGLRAVAVILVILAHASVPGFEGGYIGVDVFFVISGFVITSLLRRQPPRHVRYNLAYFYARRIRRIVPAATLTSSPPPSPRTFCSGRTSFLNCSATCAGPHSSPRTFD